MFTKRIAANSAVGILVLLASMAWCGPSWAQEVKYDYDRSVDFTKYETYKWVAIKGASHPDQLTEKDIKQAIDEQMATRSLTKKDDDPVDLYIGYQISVQHEKELTGFGGGLGWRFGGGMMSATTSTIDVGTLVVDVYDPATKSLVWRGSATNSLEESGNPDKRMKHLNKAMAKLLKSFPPPASE